jgi:hypothetical protein
MPTSAMRKISAPSTWRARLSLHDAGPARLEGQRQAEQ